MDSRKGALQSAYQVEAVNGDKEAETLWDSGKVLSGQSTYIPYGGPPLKSRQRVVWRVRYWDQNGAGSAWSGWASLELGLLANDDWKGSWIHLPKKRFKPAEPHGNPTIHFRKSFTIENVPATARLYLTAKGIVEFHINGKPVTPDAFIPGWTDYTQKIETLSYDIGPLLRKGENVLAARIADGWFAGTISNRVYGTMPELLAQVELKSEDGELLKTIVTDDTWQLSTDGPITMADIWHGEDYDARKELKGWDQPGYAASDNFQLVEVSPIESKVRLAPKRFQTTRVTEFIEPISFECLSDGRVVYDFGQNMVGWVSMHLPARKNRTVTLRVAEMLNEDGTLYLGNYRAARSLANYTPAEDGIADYSQTFTFFGFRYVEVSGYESGAKPSSDWVRGEVLHTDFPRVGNFSSSHEKLNQLQSNIVWGQRGNFLDIPTDCPQRDERYGWTGDAQIFTPVSLFNFNTHAFWVSYLETIQMEMKPNGGVPNILPSNQYRDWVNSAGWGDAAFIIPWELYLRCGDIGVLEEFYPMMVKRLGYYCEKAINGLVDEPASFGDWLQPRSYGTKPIGTDERSGETSTRLLTSCYFARGADFCSRAAEALEKKDDANKHASLFREISGAITHTFFDEEGRGIEGTATQTAYALPLAFGLLNGAHKTRVAQHLSKRIEDDGNLLNTGFIGTSVIVSVLEQNGLLDQALAILFSSEYPSWFYSIDQGATTMWERWNSYTRKDGFGDDSMNSFNHYAYGAVGQFMYERLAGIAPTPKKPGYEEISIAPILNEVVPLTHAQASLETRFGNASSEWRKTENGWDLNVIIPPNSSARIELPFEPSAISGNAEFIQQKRTSVATVPAGTYCFNITRRALVD